MRIKTIEINIIGIVQGVGFRPFLFNLAQKWDLKGYILNRGNAGVRLVIKGNEKQINSFIREIKEKKPKISFIEKIEIKDLENVSIGDHLEIKTSEQGRGSGLTLPPDIATCEECLKEMRNPRLKRYYNYPFIACALCGPRFTTVMELPYDRERTTMIEFPLCPSCLKEYSDFNNRRFHAQTFACSECGPNYILYDKNREIIASQTITKILKKTVNLINDGNIIAVKGIGGVHLVCKADDDDIILKLRKRKGKRKYKPFALMIPNLKVIEKFFKISEKEREIITSFRRPIVLLEKNERFYNSGISELIAPGLNNIGFMLPYSGIHTLIFDYFGDNPLVYTSGNKSNIPMGIENDKIFSQLYHLADYFLLHNRRIYQRADDSVLRIHDNKIKLIRRSRGFVPEYIPIPFEVEPISAIATGPELTVTGAVLRGNRVFPTQHIGNVTHLETFQFLKDAIFHLKNLLQIKDHELKFVACDSHPAFITTKFAKEISEEFKIPFIPIQHHFAHILGLMVENKIPLNEKIIGISTDGVGYGDDGNVWGGEILLCSYNEYKRLGHLQYQPMIGGDRCSKFPARMLASILLNTLEIKEAQKIFKKLKLNEGLEYGKIELNAIISQFEKKSTGEKIPYSSSTGRIFDVVSYLLGASQIRTYRGEPAMRLEGLAAKGDSSKIDIEINFSKKGGKYIINTSQLILDIINLRLENKYRREDIGATFQKALSSIFAELAIKIASENNIDKIGLSGGVSYNYAFSSNLKKIIEKEGFQFLEHDLVPPGDAGISVGQIIGGFVKYEYK